MAPEALVCPHCRTWVEGSGRTTRCPACGKRFKTEDARLQRAHRQATAERPDFRAPETGEREALDATPGTEEMRDPPSAGEDIEHQGWSWELQPEAADTGERGYDAAPHRPDDRLAAGTSDPGAEPASPSSEEQEMPWRWILSGLAVVLIFVGGRFLSGELFIVAFFGLIALQWLLDRGKSET